MTTNKESWYDVKVADQPHKYTVSLSAQRSANHVVKYVESFGDLQRLDLEIAPGVIQLIVPPFAPPDGSEWALVSLRAKNWNAPSDILATPGGSASFKPRDGFRGDYIALLYGDYVVSLTLGAGDDARNAVAVVSMPVTVSAEDPTVEVTFSPAPR